MIIQMVVIEKDEEVLKEVTMEVALEFKCYNCDDIGHILIYFPLLIIPSCGNCRSICLATKTCLDILEKCEVKATYIL